MLFAMPASAPASVRPPRAQLAPGRACEAVTVIEVAWATMTNPIDAKLEDLRERREQAYHAGSPRSVERQPEKGKRLARERLDYFLDPGSFQELDLLARHRARRRED